jgi:hypothetical protein
MTLSIFDSQYSNAVHYAECHILFIVILSVAMLNGVAPLQDTTQRKY